MTRLSSVIPFLASLLALSGWGCASYTARLERSRSDFIRADYTAALESITRIRPRRRDLLVFLFERGTIRHTMGDFEGSNRDFEAAYQLVREYDDCPVISGRDALGETVALLTNETALPYEGEGFERILLHVYKALNFLMLGDLEGARVEIRRLDLRQNLEMAARASRIKAAEEKKRERNLDPETVSGIESKIIESLGDAAGKADGIRDLYLSGFGVYLSSLVYDLGGEYDSALIDCRRLISLSPEFRPAYLDAASYGAEEIRPPGGYDLRGRGDLVVFLQNGLAPVKREISIPVPTTRGWLSVAFPVYESVPTDLSRAEIKIGGQAAGSTLTLNNVEAQAIRSLIDRIPVMVVRQLLRLGVKGAALKAASDQAGGWGELVMSFYNLISERADVRSWLTLPRDIQAFRVYPAPGKQTVEIFVLERSGSVVGTVLKEVEFAPDSTTVANIRALGLTPYLGEGVNITANWRTLHRPPLTQRPRPVWEAGVLYPAYSEPAAAADGRVGKLKEWYNHRPKRSRKEEKR